MFRSALKLEAHMTHIHALRNSTSYCPSFRPKEMPTRLPKVNIFYDYPSYISLPEDGGLASSNSPRTALRTGQDWPTHTRARGSWATAQALSPLAAKRATSRPSSPSPLSASPSRRKTSFIKRPVFPLLIFCHSTTESLSGLK